MDDFTNNNGVAPSYEEASGSAVAELENQSTAGAEDGTTQEGMNDSSGQSGQGVPQQTDFNPQGWALKYRGTTVYPKDRDHLVNLAQQGWSYSQSMEEVNKQRAEIEAQKTRFQQLEEASSLLEQHPVLNQRFVQLVNEYKQNGYKFPEQAAANQMSDEQQQNPQLKQALDKIAQLEGKLSEYDNRFQMFDAEKADAEVRSEMDAVVKKHPEADWQSDNGEGPLSARVLKLAHKYEGRISLEEAYRLLTYDNLRTNVEAEALKKAKEKREQETKNGIVANSGGVKPQQRQQMPSSYKDAAAIAVQEFGG